MPRVTLDLPGCKSASQRALILAALAEGESVVSGLSSGEDSKFLLSALGALGVPICHEGGIQVRISGGGGPRTAAVDALSLGEGGSTLRFLVPMLAAAPQDLQLHVAEGLRNRPQQALVDALALQGASLTPTEHGFHLQAEASAIPETMQIPVDLSSQFFSGFLMASGRQAQRWNLGMEPVSRGYLDMTVTMLQQFRGAEVLQIQPLVWKQAVGYGTGQNYAVPSDASAVVFFAVAAILLQQEIGISQAWGAAHPDRAVLQFLEKHQLLRVEGSTLIPLGLEHKTSSFGEVPVFDLQDSPDSGPALAVLASQLPHGIRFVHPERLRFKESNRLDGMQRLAAILGGEMTEQGETLLIQPGTSSETSGPFDSSNDHRLAMSAGIASLRYPKLEIGERSCVAKSFPDFWNQLARLQ
ncbi:MAG: hypothetical protein O3A95_07770 [Planctomycetota bacterium]|nr:hypothetical protein [Planctomycetota bacterium]MDA1114179.1 hypothetical protein [Planctomycetota bacterium]